MRKLHALSVVAVLAFVAVGGAVAASPKGGPILLYATPGDGINGKIVFAGAIGDYGKTFTMDKDGKGDANGNFVKMTLKKGTFLIDATVLNKDTAKAPASVDSKATCSFGFVGNGPVTLSDGTGAYVGISGKIQITIEFVGDGPLYASGAHKGQCNTSNNAQPLAQFGVILGKGTVAFG